MLPRSHDQLSQKEQAALGLPSGFKLYSPAPFGGMDQSATRIGSEDKDYWYSENFIRVGNFHLRTVWDKGNPVYTVPTGKTIVYAFFYNIGAINYVIVFLSDGTSVQVNPATGATVTVSNTPNTFYAGGQLPCCASWGSQYLLIANNITPNSYWVWDGAILYSSGTLGPIVVLTSSGSGYTSPPTVTAFGGEGTGATFTANIANGSVVAVVVNNPGIGYEPGDYVQLAFSGGGTDSSAILEAVLSVGTIQTINLLAGGSGYTSPVVTITGGGGTGATATATESGGAVNSITVTNRGSGYTGTPTVTITDGGPGTGASALAILNPGSVASVNIINGGTNFTATPTLTFMGGGGTGATATATLTGGVITSVTVTDGGTGYTETPAVVVESGINNAASGTISLMPFTVSGTSIETFQQRVWLPFPNQQGQVNNAGTFLVSAPESFTDFATSDGGDIYVSSSPYLRAQYYNIKQSNGYLYPFGDSSVDVISNVQTTGTPPTTTFNYQNTDPQVGTSWRDSCIPYSRSILFANPFGVYGLYGGSATKISAKMDGIFNEAIFPPTVGAITPCSAIADIYSQKVFLLLMTIQDPITLAYKNALLAWDEKDWVILTQSSTLTFITTQEVNSVINAWGTDGTNLFQLFDQPSATLQKTLSSKLYGAQNEMIEKSAMAFYVQGQDRSTNSAGLNLGITIDNENTSTPIPNNPIIFQAPVPKLPMFATGTGDVFGQNLGFTLTSTSPDFVISYLALGYVDYWGGFGSRV